jgi:hypothetical protein
MCGFYVLKHDVSSDFVSSYIFVCRECMKLCNLEGRKLHLHISLSYCCLSRHGQRNVKGFFPSRVICSGGVQEGLNFPRDILKHFQDWRRFDFLVPY